MISVLDNDIVFCYYADTYYAIIHLELSIRSKVP